MAFCHTQQQDFKAVNVRLLGGFAGVGNLRRHVPNCDRHHGGLIHLLVVDQTGEPKVSKVGTKSASNNTLLGLMSRCSTTCTHSSYRYSTAAATPAEQRIATPKEVLQITCTSDHVGSVAGQGTAINPGCHCSCSQTQVRRVLFRGTNPGGEPGFYNGFG